MDAPAISVIIPVYNVEEYIARCIHSVIGQEMDDMEVILVDDCSPCNSIHIATSVLKQERFTHYRVVKKTVNGGLGAARNEGIRVARGKYLFFLDSDDWLAKGALKTLLAAAVEKDYDLVAADFFIGYDKYAYPASIFRHVTDTTVEKSFLLNYNPAAWNKLYKKELFTAANIFFPEERQWYEDVATIPLIIARAKKIRIIKQPVLYYYQRADSIMGETRRGNPKLFDIFKSLDRLIANRRFFTRKEWIELEDNLVFHGGAARLDDIFNIKSPGKRYSYMRSLYGLIKAKLPRWNTSFPFNEHHNNYTGRTRFFVKRTFTNFVKGKIMCALFWSCFIRKESDTRLKILISIPTLHMGGAEKVLVNMLHRIDYDKYNVTLYVFEETGVFEKHIPRQHIKLIKRVVSRKKLYAQSFLGTIFSSKIPFRDKILKVRMTFFKKIAGRDIAYQLFVTGYEPLPYHRYDIAVAYTDLTPDMSEFITRHVNAKKKIIWIHNDFNPAFIDYIDDHAFEKMFASFDSIVAVSSGAARSFAERFKLLAGKLAVINNVIDTESIKERALEPIQDVRFEADYINLVSVGRVDLHVKGFDRIVSVSRRLIDDGLRFRWYIIGDGKDLASLRDSIARNGLENTVISMGARENPYKYIKACNALVLTSRFEAYPTVVIEAHTLGVPCIVTRNAGCYDQFCTITTHIIAENNENDLLRQLRRFLSDDRLRMEMKNAVQQYYYNNDDIMKKMDRLFGLKTPGEEGYYCPPADSVLPVAKNMDNLQTSTNTL